MLDYYDLRSFDNGQAESQLHPTREQVIMPSVTVAKASQLSFR